MGVTLAAVLGRSSLRETLAMLTDWELWACAQHYIREHAEGAPVVASLRADELLEEGDDEGARTYRGIVRRINQLLDPPSGPLN